MGAILKNFYQLLQLLEDFLQLDELKQKLKINLKISTDK